MITINVIYPNGQTVERHLYPTQAQMIINAMRADGAMVVIVSNPTTFIVA